MRIRKFFRIAIGDMRRTVVAAMVIVAMVVALVAVASATGGESSDSGSDGGGTPPTIIPAFDVEDYRELRFEWSATTTLSDDNYLGIEFSVNGGIDWQVMPDMLVIPAKYDLDGLWLPSIDEVYGRIQNMEVRMFSSVRNAHERLREIEGFRYGGITVRFPGLEETRGYYSYYGYGYSPMERTAVEEGYAALSWELVHYSRSRTERNWVRTYVNFSANASILGPYRSFWRRVQVGDWNDVAEAIDKAELDLYDFVQSIQIMGVTHNGVESGEFIVRAYTPANMPKNCRISWDPNEEFKCPEPGELIIVTVPVVIVGTVSSIASFSSRSDSGAEDGAVRLAFMLTNTSDVIAPVQRVEIYDPDMVLDASNLSLQVPGRNGSAQLYLAECEDDYCTFDVSVLEIDGAESQVFTMPPQTELKLVLTGDIRDEVPAGEHRIEISGVSGGGGTSGISFSTTGVAGETISVSP